MQWSEPKDEKASVQMPVHLFVPHFEIDECLAEMRECLEKGWTGLGFKTVEFENKWKEYTGLLHAHFVNSATAGLHLAIKILKMENGWLDGDEVISTPLTFVSTNHAIMYESLQVVFADVDKYLCLCPKSVEERITDKTKAVMYVGYGGGTGRYDEIVKICKEHNLKLILDAAHMAGTRLNGVIPGQEADAVVYSFQAVKNLPTADSGMICFRETKHDELCRKLTWLGINKDTYTRSYSKGKYLWRYDVDEIGYKAHGNSIMAALGLVGLRYLDRDNDYRRQIAEWYDRRLSKNDNVCVVPNSPNCQSSRHLYVISVQDRDGLMVFLNNKGIYPGVHYRDNTEYIMYSYAKGTCPNASKLSNSILSLPMHMKMTEDDVDYICEMIYEFDR